MTDFNPDLSPNLNGRNQDNYGDPEGFDFEDVKAAAEDFAEEARTKAKTSDAAEALRQFADHQKKAAEELGKAIESLLPEGFRAHGGEARREFAKGLKVLVDAAVTELEKANRNWEQNRQNATPPTGDEPGRPSSTGAQKVKVQVD